MFGGPVRIKRFYANDVEIVTVCICMPILFIMVI